MITYKLLVDGLSVGEIKTEDPLRRFEIAQIIEDFCCVNHISSDGVGLQ